MSFQPPVYTFSVVSLNPSSGKSCLCKRLIDSNWDNYQTFLNGLLSSKDERQKTWFYWGSIKHRRFDEKREAIFHFIEQYSTSSLSSSSSLYDDNESFDGDLKRLSTLTFRFDQSKAIGKEKVTVDGFICIYDICSNSSLNEFISLVQILLKTRRSVIVVTTKNDLVDDQSSVSNRFEDKIHGTFSNIPIVHTSSHEHVNIQSVLESALYSCDETTRKSNRIQFQPPNYNDAWKNEQSLKHVIQTEYRALLSRHVPDFRLTCWSKFYDRWQHHTTVQTFLDMFGKEQAQCLYHEHLDELKKIYRQKLIDERLIPVIEHLITDPKLRFSRNWDLVRLDMQKNPRYCSTVIESSAWPDFERNSTSTLCIPSDILETAEARHRFEVYVNHRQAEQIRRVHCRSFFDLLTRFAEAGLVHYGDSYEKDSVYFLGRESFEALTAQDRVKIFSLHQTYLFRLLTIDFVELLFESLEIFIKTFEKMNLATNLRDESNFQQRTLNNLSIDEIFQQEIIEQIKDDPRYKALEKRETDRQRLIMCHCHFLYDCFSNTSMNSTIRSLDERRRSSKRRKSSSISSLNLDEQYCPYTKKLNEESSSKKGKDFQIVCPTDKKCVDLRSKREIWRKLRSKWARKVLVFGEKVRVDRFRSELGEEIESICEAEFLELRPSNVDVCFCVSSSYVDRCREFLVENKLEIPTIEFFDEFDEEKCRFSVEDFLHWSKGKFSVDLRIAVCSMCGGEKNEVETFLDQLSSRLTLTPIGASSLFFSAFVGRKKRKVELNFVSFHSLLNSKVSEFDGFILLYDRDRAAAVRTMKFLEKNISNNLKNEFEENRQIPIYLLSSTGDVPTQRQKGTIKTFLETNFFLFLHQCLTNFNDPTTDADFNRSEESINSEVLMTNSVDRLRLPNVSTSKSNDHSPRHRHSDLRLLNEEQIFHRSFPHLSKGTKLGESTIVPTTPVDSSSSISTNSTSDSSQQIFQKSTSMKFAKLIEHPTNGTNFQWRNGNSNPRKFSANEETKFHFGRNRTSLQVKVPLATPEIVELNEFLSTTNENSIPRAESSVDSSSDERLPSNNVSSLLQRKSSDRKSKRIRAKINENVASPNTENSQKKLVSDDDVLQDDEKQQKKKRRPSLKRKKRLFNDQNQNDSGIDSRMDLKDSNKVNGTPEASLSSNVVVSNEEDSSLGDFPKDSKNASIEELGDRPAANWIRRQLQYFAQSRREKNESKNRCSTTLGVSSPPFSASKLGSSSNVSSIENSSHHLPIRFKFSSFPMSEENSVPLFIEKSIRFIEQHGIAIEGLYRISGYKNQVDFVIQKLIEDPNCDLNNLQIPASAVATALKDIMRKLDEPILSLEQFEECQTLTVEQLKEQQFEALKQALSKSSELKYRTNKIIFKHLHFVAQHSATTHMDSSNLAVLWWPNLFQPQFHDLRTAEQICQKAKPLVQMMIDHFETIFSSTTGASVL